MYNAQEAIKVINDIEPKIIIPIGQKSENDPNADDVEKFIKELGLTPKTTDKKVIIKQKDLPQEETEVYVLIKE